MSNAIEVRGLTYRAGRSFSLDDVSLSVPAGSIHGFLGPNGAGKSTTVRLLLELPADRRVGRLSKVEAGKPMMACGNTRTERSVRGNATRSRLHRGTR